MTELKAFDTNSVNVTAALAGATASATSDYAGDGGAGAAIDGNILGNYGAPPGLYASATPGSGEALTITLGASAELGFLTIYGRNDCCTTRDVYNIALLDSFGNTLATIANVDATTGPATVALADVPEPASLSILGMGLLGLARLRRRAR